MSIQFPLPTLNSVWDFHTQQSQDIAHRCVPCRGQTQLFIAGEPMQLQPMNTLETESGKHAVPSGPFLNQDGHAWHFWVLKPETWQLLPATSRKAIKSTTAAWMCMYTTALCCVQDALIHQLAHKNASSRVEQQGSKFHSPCIIKQPQTYQFVSL